jgi:hypothetical protein
MLVVIMLIFYVFPSNDALNGLKSSMVLKEKDYAHNSKSSL